MFSGVMLSEKQLIQIKQLGYSSEHDKSILLNFLQ